MDPMTIAAIMGGFQTAVGAAQAIGGAGTLLGNRRPEKRIPTAATRNLALSQMRAYQDMPGLIEARGRASLAENNAIMAAQQGGRGTAAIAGIYGQSARERERLTTQNLQYRSRMMDQYQQDLSRFGQLQDQVWMYNEFGPYEQRFQEGRDVLGAGIENIFGGLDIYGKKALANSSNTALDSFFEKRKMIDDRNDAIGGSRHSGGMGWW